MQSTHGRAAGEFFGSTLSVEAVSLPYVDSITTDR